MGNIRDTTTARSSAEELLVSLSAERSIYRYDSSALAGKRVAIDDSYLDTVDKPYIMARLRYELAHGGAVLPLEGLKAPDLDVVIEPRAGAVGINDPEWGIGIPSLPIGYSDVYFLTPDLTFTFDPQYGWTKLTVCAYDVKTLALLDTQVMWGRSQTGWFEDIYPGLLERVEEQYDAAVGDEGEGDGAEQGSAEEGSTEQGTPEDAGEPGATEQSSEQDAPEQSGPEQGAPGESSGE